MIRTRLLIAMLLTMLVIPGAWAQEEQKPEAKTQDAKFAAAPADGDWSVTEHEVSIAGRAVPYTATAGTIQLKDSKDQDKAKASMFFIAYTAKQPPGSDVKPQDRPVMFCFNGGPGSSSVWLHMGCFGPRRVHMDDVGHAVGPPYELKDNAMSLLDTTDLVFIDPVSTGFSRAEEGTSENEYHSVTGDINSVAEFIRLWITKNDRWLSPKYLAGESYGTTRAAGVANRLQSKGIDLNGIVLVSAVLNFQTIKFDEGNDLPYQLYLPTYTALAHYHGKLSEGMLQRELPELLDEAEAWSRKVYGPALMEGAAISGDDKSAIAEGLHRYTGLPMDLIVDSNLRIPQWRFGGNLLKDSTEVIGRFDGRIIGPDLDKASDRSGANDPSYSRVAGGFTATFNDYVRGELGYETEMDYGILVGVRWNYDRAKASYLNVASDLRQAMAENPRLRVYVAAGYYDLATPYHAAEYTINHSITHPGSRDRVTFGYFESGHMLFTHAKSLEQFRDELLTWEYLDGEITPTRAEILSKMLAAKAAARQRFVEAAVLHGMLFEYFKTEQADASDEQDGTKQSGGVLSALMGVLSSPRWVLAGPGESSLGMSFVMSDLLMNLALYLPLGVTVRMALRARRRSWSLELLGTLAIAFALSWSVESLQSLMPTRYASLNDVLANCGAALFAALVAPGIWRLYRAAAFGLYCRLAGVLASLRNLAQKPAVAIVIAAINALVIGLWYVGELQKAGIGDQSVLALPFERAFQLPYDLGVLVLGEVLLAYAGIGCLLMLLTFTGTQRLAMGWVVLAVVVLAFAAEVSRAATHNTAPDITGPLLALSAAAIMTVTIYTFSFAVKRSNRRHTVQAYDGPDRRRVPHDYA
eukprot:g14949.t1